MLELLYPVVLAALLLVISRIVKRIAARAKSPVEYSNPSMWNVSGGRVPSDIEDGGNGFSRAVDMDDSDRGGGFGGGSGSGGGDPEVMLTPRNLCQQQGLNSIEKILGLLLAYQTIKDITLIYVLGTGVLPGCRLPFRSHRHAILFLNILVSIYQPWGLTLDGTIMLVFFV